MIKESTEWRKHVEANSSLMKRFDESRLELEKVLKMAQNCLTERGNPEELLKKHTVRKRGLCKIQDSTACLTIMVTSQFCFELMRHTDHHYSWVDSARRICKYSVIYACLNTSTSPGTAWNNATEMRHMMNS